MGVRCFFVISVFLLSCSSNDSCDGNASVTGCEASEAGHYWLGYPCPPEIPIDLGGSTSSINANDAMWELFSRTSLP